jgi:hypothetical protein
LIDVKNPSCLRVDACKSQKQTYILQGQRDKVALYFSMPASLSSHLKAARLRQFVGREAESQMFAAALHSDELPFFVLYIFGPGGVGKSFLLRHFAALAEDAGATAISIDGRNMEPTSQGFNNVIRAAARIEDEHAELWPALTANGKRVVIFVDTYETLAPLDDWLRDEWLPNLPENVLLVLAGRQTPSAGWRADPVWNTLIRPLPLRNLNPDEARAYLTQRSIPDAQLQAVLNFTHGHPLALSLVADTFAQRGSMTSFTPEETPDVIKVLLEQFVQRVPSPAHRAALEACSLVRTLTEGLLSQMLSVPDAHELFEWLRDLSFIESGRNGLFPHDLAREAIAADVRWRNPDWHGELHKRARAYYNARLQQVHGSDQQRVIFDFTYLHRDNAMMRQYVDWQESGSTRIEPARARDMDAMVNAIQNFEGEEAAQIARYWFSAQPEGVLTLREGERVTGYLVRVVMSEASDADLQRDPIAQRAWQYAQRHNAPRTGEVATLFRFWGATDTHQQVSSVQSLIFISAVQYYLTTPRLAVTLFAVADPDFWELLTAYSDLERVPELEWDQQGRRYGIVAHDWRVTPPAQWLELMAERETAINPPNLSRPKPASPVIALSEPDFAAALRDALKLMSRSLTLRGNALMNTRLVADCAGATANEHQRADALKRLIAEAADSLQATPRDMKLHRAFYHTYLKPAASQEQASEIIDVPFSTYRRHLQAGVDRVTELLWRKELGE